MDNSEIKSINKVYSIQIGDIEDEFFSFYLPEIKESNLIINNPFKKGIINETILNEVVEEYYSDNLSDTPSISFLLSKGILLKEFDINTLVWLNRNKEEADRVIKDKIIIKYQQILPNLMNKINNMETQLKTTKTKRQQNDDLMDL